MAKRRTCAWVLLPAMQGQEAKYCQQPRLPGQSFCKQHAYDAKLAAKHDDADYVEEASTLGFAPGQWPTRFEHDFGNGPQVFTLGQLPEGDDGNAVYTSGDDVLHVLND